LTMPWVLTPPAAYLMEAQAIARELEAQGIVLTQDQAKALARAKLGPDRKWIEDEPVLSPQARQILDQIVADRAQRHGLDLDLAQVQDQRPRGAREIVPEGIDVGSEHGLDRARVVSHSGAQVPKRHVRDEKIDRGRP
jgi:hypothetical protein